MKLNQKNLLQNTWLHVSETADFKKLKLHKITNYQNTTDLNSKSKRKFQTQIQFYTKNINKQA